MEPIPLQLSFLKALPEVAVAKVLSGFVVVPYDQVAALGWGVTAFYRLHPVGPLVAPAVIPSPERGFMPWDAQFLYQVSRERFSCLDTKFHAPRWLVDLQELNRRELVVISFKWYPTQVLILVY